MSVEGKKGRLTHGTQHISIDDSNLRHGAPVFRRYGRSRTDRTFSGAQRTTTVNNTTPYGATGLPVSTSPVTIEGNNSTITRGSGAPDFRIFAVSSSGNLTLQETTVRGGSGWDLSC